MSPVSSVLTFSPETASTVDEVTAAEDSLTMLEGRWLGCSMDMRGFDLQGAASGYGIQLGSQIAEDTLCDRFLKPTQEQKSIFHSNLLSWSRPPGAWVMPGSITHKAGEPVYTYTMGNLDTPVIQNACEENRNTP